MPNDASQQNTQQEEGRSLSETAAWYWFVYESSLGLRRAKEIVVTHVISAGQSLYDILRESPPVWELALGLTPEEAQTLEGEREGLDQVISHVSAWLAGGMGLVRQNQPGYPPTLYKHMRPESRPLLLSYRGQLDLLDLPLVLALAGETADEEATAWTIETLMALAAEGALPLAVTRAGLDVEIVRSLLAMEAPLALVVAQGLAGYQPPPTLAGALEAGRALLLSPFQPVWTPPAPGKNPMVKHAAAFAQALAHALLIVTPPHPTGLTPEQPCFLRPGLPKTIGCQTYYEDPAQLFLKLIETPVAAAEANASAPLFTEPEPKHTVTPEPEPDPEELIAQLSELGNVPETLKARLRKQSPPD